MRRSVPLLRPIYEKRNAVIASSELQESDFWPRVFANAPGEIDHYILPSDAAIIGECLKNLTVERFEVDENGQGEPRSVRFTFEFTTGEENRYFENAKLVKDFYWRQEVTKSAKGKRRTWEGLVSEPVRINWKEGMDPTKGLLDAACDLAEAEKKKEGEDRKTLPEYEKLVKKVAEAEADAVTGGEGEEADDDDLIGSSPAGVSFFAFFGYRGKDVSAEKSKEAEKEEEERWAKIAKGEKVDDEDEDEDDDDDDEFDDFDEDDLEDAEIFPDGEDLAIAIAEDLWPGALKYYGEFCKFTWLCDPNLTLNVVQSYELGDELDEDFDIDEMEEDEFDEDAENDEENDEEEEERPRKKARK